MKKEILFPDIHCHRALFFCVHQFNVLPTRYIHSSWLRDLTGPVRTDIRKIWKKNPRAEKHCAAWIIKTFCQGFIYDFSDAIRRVALLPSTGLARLMVYTGLAINAHSIMQTISGQHVKALAKAFGPEAYEFASNRASLLAGSHRFDFLQPQRADKGLHSGDILESGRRCLQICLEGLPAPLVRRFRLKFHRNMPWDFSRRSEQVVRMNCRQLIHKIMKMEIRPQWNPALS